MLAPRSSASGPVEGDVAYLALTRRRVRDRSSHLRCCRWIYEANRRPRLAAQPENRPRRNLVAPVCLLPSQCSGVPEPPSSSAPEQAKRRIVDRREAGQDECTEHEADVTHADVPPLAVAPQVDDDAEQP